MTDIFIEVIVNFYWKRFRFWGIGYLSSFFIFLVAQWTQGFFIDNKCLQYDPPDNTCEADFVDETLPCDEKRNRIANIVLSLIQIILIWVFFFYEFMQFLSLKRKKEYFISIRNLFDLIHVLVTVVFCSIVLSSDESRVDFYVIVLFISFIKFFLLLQNIDSVRSLTTKLITVISDMYSFFVLVLLCLACFSMIFFAKAYSNIAPNSAAKYILQYLRFTYDAFFGNWGDVEVHDWVFLFFAILTILFTVVMFNVLIAIITDSFDEANQNSRAIDNRQKLDLIIEFLRVERVFRRQACRKQNNTKKKNKKSDYIYIYRPVFGDEDQERKWEGKISAFNVELSHLQSEIIKVLKDNEANHKKENVANILREVESKINILQEERNDITDMIEVMNFKTEKDRNEKNPKTDKLNKQKSILANNMKDKRRSTIEFEDEEPSKSKKIPNSSVIPERRGSLEEILVAVGQEYQKFGQGTTIKEVQYDDDDERPMGNPHLTLMDKLNYFINFCWKKVFQNSNLNNKHQN